MLASISWQHYITATILITAIYYFYVALRYYQKEIAGIFHTTDFQSPTDSIISTGALDVIGKGKQDLVTVIENDDTLFYEEVIADEPEPESNDYSIKKPSTANDINFSDDLENDCQKLIDAYKKKDDKEGFLSLLNILITSFERYKPTTDMLPVLEWIVEHANEKLLFSITISDLKNANQ